MRNYLFSTNMNMFVNTRFKMVLYSDYLCKRPQLNQLNSSSVVEDRLRKAKLLLACAHVAYVTVCNNSNFS